MTIESVRGKLGREPKTQDAAPLAIGEVDSRIFPCPSCSRPLAVGTHRCPGCGTRLVMSVRLSRAVVFTTFGLALGLAIGGGGAAIALAVGRTSAPATSVPTASAAPGSQPIASSPVGNPPADPSIPAAALSAMRQGSVLNQRLASDAEKLAAVLAIRDPSTPDIAKALRSIAADAYVGASIAPAIAGWSDATPLADRMTTFYGSLSAVALDGLAASVTNTPAYQSAARRTLAVFADLRAIDADARTLAAKADVELAPLIAP